MIDPNDFRISQYEEDMLILEEQRWQEEFERQRREEMEAERRRMEDLMFEKAEEEELRRLLDE